MLKNVIVLNFLLGCKAGLIVLVEPGFAVGVWSPVAPALLNSPKWWETLCDISGVKEKEDESYWSLLEMVSWLSVSYAGHWLKMPVQLFSCGSWFGLAVGGGGGWFHSHAAAASERRVHTPCQKLICLCEYMFSFSDQPAAAVTSRLVGVKMGRV